jgi:hypothetical protein
MGARASALCKVPGQPNKNRFVVAIVRAPFVSALFCFALTLLFAIVGIKYAIDNEFVSRDSSNYDIHDIRSKRVDSLKVANDEYFGQDFKIDEEYSEEGDILLVYYESHTDNAFTAEGVAAMKKIDEMVTNDPKFETYCERKYSTTEMGNWTCEESLTPYKMFHSRVPPSVIDESLFATIPDLGSTSDCAMTQLMVGEAPAAAAMANMTIPACISPTALAALDRMASTECTSIPAADMLNAKKLMLQISYYHWGCKAWYIFDLSNDELTAIDPTLKGYRDTCFAALPALTGGWDGSSTNSQDIAETLKIASKIMLVPSFKFTVDFFMDKNFGPTNLKSKYTRSIVRFRNMDDDGSEEMGDWFIDNFKAPLNEMSTDKAVGLDVLYFATPVLLEEFLNMLTRDGLLALMSMVFVFCWIWGQTGSLFIAIAGMTEILFSIPLALFTYRIILGLDYFGGINLMGLYIVMGIGADDIFVFVDAWKQSAYEGPDVLVDLETRMSFVYGRAGYAMLITSATTCFAFVATSLSPLVEVQSFGIFAALVILMDYLMVITWFTACMVIYHNHLEMKANCLCLPCCAPNVCCSKPGIQGAADARPPSPEGSNPSRVVPAAAPLSPDASTAPVQQMQITVPENVKPGDTISVNTGSGQLPIVVPADKNPGDLIIITIPVNPAQVAVSIDAAPREGSGMCCPSIQTKCPSFISTVTAFIASVAILMYTANSVSKLEPFLPQEIVGLFVGCILLTVLVAVLYVDPHFDGFCVHCNKICASLTADQRSTAVHRRNQQNNANPTKRVVETFMEYKYGPWLAQQKNRLLIFGFFLVVVIVWAVFASNIGPTTRSDQWFREDHKFQRIFDIGENEFGTSNEDNPTTVYIAYGIDTIE